MEVVLPRLQTPNVPYAAEQAKSSHEMSLPCMKWIIVPCDVCGQLTETTNASHARATNTYCESCRREEHNLHCRKYYETNRQRILAERAARWNNEQMIRRQLES